MGEISKKTLAVLLLVAIVLSAVATWKMLGSERTVVVVGEEPKGDSHVSFNVVGDEVPPEPVLKTGQVSIKIE
ncbi:hypothetical protein KY308_00010 [Candidatus Woesearchaeota archaeon]|nr:hypothetical protein [Candidatus Woesearchaeota archaeon]